MHGPHDNVQAKWVTAHHIDYLFSDEVRPQMYFIPYLCSLFTKETIKEVVGEEIVPVIMLHLFVLALYCFIEIYLAHMDVM